MSCREREILQSVIRPGTPILSTKVGTFPVIDIKQICIQDQGNAEREFSSVKFAEYQNRRSRFNEQQFVTFDCEEVSAGLREVLDLPTDFQFASQPIKVFAGYTGRFAQVMQNLGFNVLVSDINPYWVKEMREKGIHANELAAQNLPRYPEALFSINFEAYPVLQATSGYLTFLRESANTKKGVVTIESIESNAGLAQEVLIDHVERGMGWSIHSLVEPYGFFCQHYGLSLKIVDTEHLRFYGYKLDEDGRQKARQDLYIIYRLRHVMVIDNRYVEISLKKVAQQLGIKVDSLIESITRISNCLQNMDIISELFGDDPIIPRFPLVPQESDEKRHFLYRLDKKRRVYQPTPAERLLEGIINWVSQKPVRLRNKSFSPDQRI